MTHITAFANNFEPRICGSMDTGAASGRTSHRAFAGVSALLFATSAALTIVWCGPMSAMGGMRMPGQTWPAAAGSFAVRWTVMMVAMMPPSLAPTLWRYREAMALPAKHASAG